VRKTRIPFVFLISVFSLVFVGILIWLSSQSKPVVYSYSDPATPSLVPTFVVFNPFRDREPENTAQQLLNRLKKGECERAISNLFSAADLQIICEKEAKYKLEDWDLRDRTDQDDTVSLHYRVKRADDPGYGGYGSINLQRSPSDWNVVDLSFIY
jgi:hypothetical protein